MSEPVKKVFISYSHDSDEHKEKVLALANRLRQDGIHSVLDQYENGTPVGGWPRWMMDQLDVADFVLVVCTETYYRRFRGHEEPGKGKGVDWEGALITNDVYKKRSQTLKFVPIFLSDPTEDWIPDFLYSVNYYALTSEVNYQKLYYFLRGQAGEKAPPVGSLKDKPPRPQPVLNFSDSASSVPVKVDISRIDRYAPEELIGRETEMQLLNDAWDKAVRGETGRPRVLTFMALGGEGKTSLVAKWAAELAHRDWPGCDTVFAWTFYSQGTRDQAAASSDLFLKEALLFFGDIEMANSAQGVYDKGKRLAQLVGGQRALLILDGLEPLQYSPTSLLPGELKDQGMTALLKGLAAANQGLCVVTTRYSIPALKNYRQTTAPEVALKRLSKEAGTALLKSLGVKGTQKECETLVEDVAGHALTLNLLGTYLRDAYDGDIRKRDLVKLAEADAEEQGGHAFHVMDAYVKWLETGGKTAEENRKGQQALALLQLLGLFDRPATADCLEALWKAPTIPNLTETLVGLSEAERNLILKRLETARLLTVNRDSAHRLLSLDAHPLLREYFASQLRDQYSDAWRAAHQRLYEHLCATTKEGNRPTLEDLQPLYQAVAHGCQAGLQSEAREKVYRDRILRGDKGDSCYSTKRLGAFGSDLGAVACFFETPWSRASSALAEADRAWLLNRAAFSLSALGRLTEALEPMRAGLEMRVKRSNWDAAAKYASNLTDLELFLGEVAGAVADAEQAVIYADQGHDASLPFMTRTVRANALHQAGRRIEAETLFRETEQMQAELLSEYPLLHSLDGFQYCDLLLSEVERIAAKREYEVKHNELLNVCRDVEHRAQQTLEWVTSENYLLDIALDHLTLGRAALYSVILEQADFQQCSPNFAHIHQAVDGLRRAGQRQYLPLGLFTRAWLRSLNGPRTGPESAQSDLDEAWEIAERGPMPLHMADIHLYRARLFYREAKYPWESPQADLAEARRLIEKHGYWRRKEELEDAEEMVNGFTLAGGI